LSRENVEWGIATPWDKTQTVYVWFDALINYYSATQFVENKKEFWPANIHLLGKEILWFHTVIWQAMLLSAEIELPIKTFTHSFYMVDGQKMSKSLGNVISPQQLIDLFGVDGTRYLIARSFPTENDSDVGVDRFKDKYNADLANNLGNLVSRITKLAYGNSVKNDNFSQFLEENYVELIDNCRFDEAIGLIFEKYIDSSNAKLNEVAPWKLEVNDPSRIEVLNYCINNLRLATLHLKPIMPEVVKKIENCLENKVKLLESPLFPRIK
jgi:methionyl-tRNA synthetase